MNRRYVRIDLDHDDDSFFMCVIDTGTGETLATGFTSLSNARRYCTKRNFVVVKTILSP